MSNAQSALHTVRSHSRHARTRSCVTLDAKARSASRFPLCSVSDEILRSMRRSGRSEERTLRKRGAGLRVLRAEWFIVLVRIAVESRASHGRSTAETRPKLGRIATAPTAEGPPKDDRSTTDARPKHDGRKAEGRRTHDRTTTDARPKDDARTANARPEHSPRRSDSCSRLALGKGAPYGRRAPRSREYASLRSLA